MRVVAACVPYDRGSECPEGNIRLSCYALATNCSVLTCGMLAVRRPGSKEPDLGTASPLTRYATFGTAIGDTAYHPVRCPVPIVEKAYAKWHGSYEVVYNGYPLYRPMPLLCEVRYCHRSCYRPTPCPVLTNAMRLPGDIRRVASYAISGTGLACAAYRPTRSLCDVQDCPCENAAHRPRHYFPTLAHAFSSYTLAMRCPVLT
eukprot:3941298-Rhodomonas_salina.1